MKREFMTSDEHKVFEFALNLDEKFFKDMRFETKDLKKLLLIKYQNDDGTFQKVEGDLPGWENILLADCPIKIKKMKNCGEFKARRKMIFIRKGLSGEDLKETLLHEIIHFYEHNLLRPFYDYLLLYFYEKLQKKIGKKKLRHLIRMDKFYLDVHADRGELSSILFLFKSLDLDLKLKKPFGTIFAYEREKYF